MHIGRRTFASGLAVSLLGCGPPDQSAAPSAPVQAYPSEPARSVEIVTSQLVQGGYLLGRAPPNAKIVSDGLETVAAPDGWFVVGFDRDAGTASNVSVFAGEHLIFDHPLEIAQRDFPFQRINVPRGVADALFSPEWFDLTDPALVDAWRDVLRGSRDIEGPERVESEVDMKAAAYASVAPLSDFSGAWSAPVRGRVTSQWGARRVLVTPDGEKPPQTHCGVDVACLSGTPVNAPIGGLVTLAQSNMRLEGGCVFVDHGMGLTSVYLHMNEVVVELGQRIVASDSIGSVGATGRASGPHLCWRLKWRDRHLDPTLWIGGAPALQPS